MALFPGTAFHGALTVQVNGFASDVFLNNSVVLLPSLDAPFLECTTAITPTAPAVAAAAAAAARPTPPLYADNSYHVIGGSLAPGDPFPQRRCAHANTTFEQWQALGLDAGSTLIDATVTHEALIGRARQWLHFVISNRLPSATIITGPLPGGI